MAIFSWTCPFCNQPVTIKDEQDVTKESLHLSNPNTDGTRMVITRFIICPNPDCKKLSFDIHLYEYSPIPNLGWRQGDLIQSWSLIPESKAKSFPDYIPQAILDDYNEICLILQKSPKAAAALSRRCLQGMIRDFWGVKAPNLWKEIEAIKDKTDADTWEAIDAVRSVGNIGAHMEKDVNLIIDVDPSEANTLVGLIEILLGDWYIARHNREEHLQKVKLLADTKGKKSRTHESKDSGAL